MKARAIQIKDLEKLKELHDKYYSQFEFPAFFRYLNSFVIEDDEGDIIMAGGVENVAEISLVTNKDKSRIAIGRALVETKEIALFTCKRMGIKDLYAFVDNDDYAKHLIQHGFTDCPRALSLRVK